MGNTAKKKKHNKTVILIAKKIKSYFDREPLFSLLCMLFITYLIRI